MDFPKALQSAWQQGASCDNALQQAVVEINCRAAGIWRIEGSNLLLAGFGTAHDMPDEVSRGFRNETRIVPLTRVELGIVKAAVTVQPAIGRRDATKTGLTGSATWIARFAASTSLAMPIVHRSSRTVLGVLAISTAADVTSGDEIWQLMSQLTDNLGKAVFR